MNMRITCNGGDITKTKFIWFEVGFNLYLKMKKFKKKKQPQNVSVKY